MNSIRIVFLLVSLMAVPTLHSTESEPLAEDKPVKTPEIYIPKDLEDCFRELNKNLRPEDIEKIKSGEITVSSMHFGLGMGLRNRWELWGGSRLAKYFNSIGINHPDDMSGIILESYVRKLRGEPLLLEEQVKFYQEYWEEAQKAEDQGDEDEQG